MNLSDISIKRPVLAAVMSILIVVFGIAAIQGLPVRELPNTDSAIITVTTTYTGASPEVVDTDITEVVEGAISGIAGVKYISSESRRGRGRTVIEFELTRNIDEAANDVRDAVGRVRGQLPADANEPRIVKNDSDADPVMRLSLTSDRMTAAELTDYADRFIVDRLATLEGVASIDVYGERRFAIRIWLDRAAMAARNLTIADIESALRRANVNLPAGEIESEARQLTVNFDSRLSTIEEFSDIVLDRIAGYPIRLRDVARIEPGVEDDSTIVRSDGRDAIGLAVLRQSKANTMRISSSVRAEIEALLPTLPPGMALEVSSDDATFVAASLREVLIALGLSLVLVMAVIFLFLRSWRTTLIPAITIPVALIGCFILINALGYSINVLTLLALLLAIGLVVDDAIVMLENIQRRIDLGESPLVASVLGARQVTFAILATSLTLIAVFVPISFLGGQVGRLFVEFGFVMASAVLISTFVALSACPALASKVIRPSSKGVRSEEESLGPVARGYRRLVAGAVRMPLVVLVVSGSIAAGSYYFFGALPQELSPFEDRGVAFIPLSAPQGSTLSYTDEVTRDAERFVLPYVESGEVDAVFTFAGGFGRAYRSFIVLRMAPWEEREKSSAQVAGELNRSMSQITGARAFALTPSGLGLRGSNSPLRAVIGGPDFESVKEWALEMKARADANPGLRNADIDFEQNQPQLSLRVNRALADDLGISVENVASTLQTMFASREVSRYVERGREYPVVMQADPEDRRTPSDIENLFIRAGDGKTLVPLSALVEIQEEAAAPELNRYNRLPSITLSAALSEGYDLGTAIQFVRDQAAEVLPVEATLQFSGQSQEFLETSSGVAITFALAVVIVFLVLAAQFESFVHPFIIMMSVPLAVAGAIYTMALTGLTINIYSQIGIILLVGLMAKNGILIVEFANQLRDEGYDVREAVIRAATIRLRPIVMTVLSTILGAVPLILATGAGAESRFAIGAVIIGGLLLASILTLFLTPVLYDLMARLTKPRGAVEKALALELGAVEKGARLDPAE
jgi:multidrug efflux pump